MENPIKTKCKSVWISIKTFLKLFCDLSPIHGISYFMKSNLMLIERLLWLALIICSIYVCTLIALESFDHYETKSTIVSLEKDYYFQNTSLAAMTICTTKRLNFLKFNKYCIEKGIQDGKDRMELWDFLQVLANSSYDSFENIPEYESINKMNINPQEYMLLIYNLTDDLLRHENKDDRVKTFNDREFIHSEQILTEEGICYVTNSLLGDHLSASLLITGKKQEPNPYELEVANVLHYIRYGNLFDNEITYSFVGFKSAISLYIHSPFEVMESDKGLKGVTEIYEFQTKSIEIETSENFQRDATVSQRKCFLMESNLTHFQIYTKNLCYQECRLNLAYKLCGCIPHFYPNLISKPKEVCHYKTLKKCLVSYKEKFYELTRLDSSISQCYCLQNCRESKVILEKKEVMTDSKILLGGLGGLVIVKKYPVIRFKREIIYTFTDFLVYIGGTAGLFLGFSVLGAIEIIYFFTLRLFWYVRGYK